MDNKLPTDEEVLTAFRLLKSVKRQQWLRLMKADYDNLPYLIHGLSNAMSNAVRDLCPPGFEIDR